MKAKTEQITTELQFQHADFTDVIRLSPELRIRLRRHRQAHRWSTEAGGQLFGCVQTGDLDVVTCTGPYPRDQRSRHSYRSHPASAQSSIEQMSKRGLCYLGEWHTHPEPKPSASWMDADAFERVCRLSETRVSSLILLIEGLADEQVRTSVYTQVDGRIAQWHPLSG